MTRLCVTEYAGFIVRFPLDDPQMIPKKLNLFFFFLSPSGYQHNPYNGVICNDTITATGVFASKELWRLAKGKSGVDLEWTKIPPFSVSLSWFYIYSSSCSFPELIVDAIAFNCAIVRSTVATY